MSVTCTTDVCSISTEDTVVNCCYIFSEDFMHSWIWLISIFFQSSFRHTDTTTRHEVQFEQFIVLDTEDHFVFFVDVSSCDISDRSWTSIVWETSFFVVCFCFFNNLLDVKRTFSWSS